MKQILFALLLTSLCFTVINGASIISTPSDKINTEEFGEPSKYSNNETDKATEYLDTTTLAEETNSEYFMVHTYPVRNIVMKYLVTLNNTDLLSSCMKCEIFYDVACEVLKERIKPVIIRNGTITDTTDQHIFPTYETTDDIYKDYSALAKWHSNFVLNASDPRPTGCCKLNGEPSFHKASTNFQTLITRSYFPIDKFSMKLPQDAILIPKVYSANVAYFKGRRYFGPHVTRTHEWETATREAKLILLFTDDSSFNLITHINNDIGTSVKNHRFLPICYSVYNNPLHVLTGSVRSDEKSLLIFHGDNVEASSFLVGTNDEEKLREEFLEWKRGLDFLETHHIIAFHFTKEFMKPTNSEEIFSSVFGIRPLISRTDTRGFTKIGLIDINPKRVTEDQGLVFAIVGFKKF